MKPVVRLSPEDRAALTQVRDHHAKPYVRERAAAVLQLADGVPGTTVARRGLLRPRDPVTVYRWREAYKRHGLAGLVMRPGRGRKPPSGPPTATPAAPSVPPAPAPSAQQAVLEVVRRDPHTLGVPLSRWTLSSLLVACPWLGLSSDSGLWRCLHRLHIRLKRGREVVHSPDPDYAAKQAAVAAALAEARRFPHIRALFLDEVTVFRQPTVARAYAAHGHDQAVARRSLRSNSGIRIVGTLDQADARVLTRQARSIDVATLVGFYQDVGAATPDAQRLYVIQDNWPVHHHPDLLAALEPQESPWALPLLPSWPTTASTAAQQRWGALQLPIQLVWLPTYASWLNPIEKLWRKLRQDLTHMHPWSDAVVQLKQAMTAFFAGFAQGSPALKRYVGLAIGE
ncbi:MAG: IS630 family transposase [Dehalococcoidia bacterium]